MQYTPYTSIPPRARQARYAVRRQPAALLTLWAVCAGAAFVAPLVDASNSRQGWSMLALMGSTLFVPMLWFSLQWDLTRHYVPALPLDTWTTHSVSGLVLGIVAGGVIGAVGVTTAIRLSPDVVSYEVSWWLVLLAAGAGLVVGFATLGLRQAQALNSYIGVAGAWWWVGVMAVAWVPVPLMWLGYDAILGVMVVNIYPQPHTVVKVLAAEVALLCPSLAVFAFLASRARGASMAGAPHAQPLHRLGERPIVTLSGLFVPPVAVALAFLALFVGQGLRVERAWVASGPVDYLSVSADGRVATTPPTNEKWDPSSRLRDSAPDGSMRAEVEGHHVVISATTSGGPRRSLRVISEPPPADYYAEDVVNVVRFSPDGTLLAVGTGQAIESDSSVNPSNDHAVHTWSVSDESLRCILSEPQYTVRTLAWSPDGRYLAAAGGLENRFGQFNGDNVVRVWRFELPRDGEVRESAPPTLAFTFVGHTTRVEALAWWPDGSRLVSRDASGRVVMWRVP